MLVVNLHRMFPSSETIFSDCSHTCYAPPRRVPAAKCGDAARGPAITQSGSRGRGQIKEGLKRVGDNVIGSEHGPGEPPHAYKHTHTHTDGGAERLRRRAPPERYLPWRDSQKRGQAGTPNLIANTMFFSLRGSRRGNYTGSPGI